MKHNVNSRRTSTFIRLLPSCPKEMKVNNQVLLAEVLLSEIFTSLAKAMYNKMRQERCGDGRSIKPHLPKSLWELTRDLLVARDAVSTKWNAATITTEKTMRSIFHVSRVGFSATVKKFGQETDKDVAYFCATPTCPISFQFSSSKGMIVHFFFQYLDKSGLQLTSTLK